MKKGLTRASPEEGFNEPKWRMDEKRLDASGMQALTAKAKKHISPGGRLTLIGRLPLEEKGRYAQAAREEYLQSALASTFDGVGLGTPEIKVEKGEKATSYQVSIRF